MNTEDIHEKHRFATRRGFLRGTALGASGLAFGGGMIPGAARAIPKAPDESKVSFVTGTDRRQMVLKALEPFKKEIAKGIQNKQVVVKVNLAAPYIPLTATHPDAVRALLDFLIPIYRKEILLVESPAGNDPVEKLFSHYGYDPLLKEYPVRFIDLNLQKASPFFILGNNLEPKKIQLIDMLCDPKNYIFSITRPKTHDTVIITLGLKNVVMGAPLKIPGGESFKRPMHGIGPWWLHYNLYMVAQASRPNFTIIDGLEGLQGDGPTKGDPVDHRIALAGTDVIAVDRIATDCMGVDIADMGYLNFCAEAGLGNTDLGRIRIIGSEKPADHVIKYHLCQNIAWQMQWRQELPLVK